MDPVAGPQGGDRLLLAGLTVLATALFASTWTTAIQVADSGELVAAACNAGVAHPPGYPLYTLLGNLLCRLPVSTAAGRVGLLSLLSGVAAVLAVFGIIGRLTGSRWAAVVAALVLATGSLFWRYASLAEVFALHVGLCLGAVYLTVRALVAATARARAGWLTLAAFLFGLALSNHVSSVLLLPLLLLPLLGPRDGWAPLAGRAALAAVGLLVGLAPYLHLLLADPFALPRWGDTGHLPGVLHHVLRRDYGTWSLSLRGSAGPFAATGALLAALPKQLGWVLAPLSVWGLVLLFARAAGRPLGQEMPLRRDLAAGLALAPLLTGPLFLLLFNIAPEGIGRQVVERFFLLPIALFVLPLGVALAWVERRFLSDPAASRRTIWRAAAFGVVALVAVESFGRADVSHSYAVEDYAENALSSAERGALILGTGDVRLFSFLHAQRVLGLRRDVQYVDVKMLLYDWYVRQQRWLYPGFSYRHTPLRVDSLGLIQRELRRGRPVYLAVQYNQRVRTAFGVYPIGPLLRVVDPDQRPPGLQEILAHNARLFRGFRRRGQTPRPELDPWSAMLREAFAQTWMALGQRLRQFGAIQAARRAIDRGLRWAPWLSKQVQLPRPGMRPRTSATRR